MSAAAPDPDGAEEDIDWTGSGWKPRGWVLAAPAGAARMLGSGSSGPARTCTMGINHLIIIDLIDVDIGNKGPA